MSCPHVYDIAPYALGTLDPAERADVAGHLADCLDCQAVLESIAGLPGLLARVGPDAVELEPAAADEAMFDRLVARARPGAPTVEGVDAPGGGDAAEVPHQPPTTRRRLRAGPRRWRRWVGAAAAAAVVGIGGSVWVAERSHDQVTVVAASAGEVHAKAWLSRADAGTKIRLELGGVGAEQRCSLVTVDRDGRATVASTWEAGYTGTEAFESTVPVPLDRLASLRVETDRGTLLTMPVA